MAKVEVNGAGACDLYKHLKALDAKPKGPGEIAWNFEKFVIGRNGQVVAALIDGESTLKTFVVKGGKPYLRAENPKYPDLIPAQELMIQGVFKALIRKASE